MSEKGAIVLIGMMGAGKTVVGRELALLLDVPFVDNDELIAEATGQQVADLLRADPKRFRRQELDCVREQLQSAATVVFATGGGAPATPAVADLLRAHSPVVWLQVPPHGVAERIRNEARSRPMLDGDFEERLVTLLAERTPIYESVADVTIDGSADAVTVAKAIAEALQ